MIPIEVQFGEEQYLDGVNLSHREFFEKLIESSELPKTSQINEYRWNEKFEKLTKNGDQVIAIVLSSKLRAHITTQKPLPKNMKAKCL